MEKWIICEDNATFIHRFQKVSSFAFSETTDSIADTRIPCGNTSDCRSMLTLSGDAYCQDGYCMCPRVDIGVQACSSINASMHKNKISGDAIGNTIRAY